MFVRGIGVQSGGEAHLQVHWSLPEFGRYCLTCAMLVRGIGVQSGVETHRQVRSRANVAHRRQSRPDSGLGFQATVIETV